MSELPPEPPPAEPEVAAPAAVEQGADHPIRLIVNDDLKRSRLTVIFRLILVIPHLFWIWAWSNTVVFLVIVNWFAVLIKGRSPDDMHTLLTRSLRYLTHLNAYFALIGDPYPTFFGREGKYPVDLVVEGPAGQNRWITGFRLILAIPAIILSYVFQQVMWIVAFIAWFIAIAIGRVPKGMRNLSAYCLRYQQQTYGYLMLLTERYPSLAGPTP